MWSSFPVLSLNLNGLFDGYQSFLRSGYSTLNQDQVLVSIYSYNIQILNSNLYAAHVTRHSLALEYAARRGAGTVGTLMTMEFGTMSHRSSVLTKSLDRTLEALTFADCSSVDSVASCEDVSFDFLCQCVLRRIFKPEFSYISLAGNTSFFEVSLLSFIYAMSFSSLPPVRLS